MEINVTDSGVGISDEEQDLLFKEFAKINRNRELNQDGCGLGLNISQRITEALGGKLSFESQLGIGSNFKISLPVDESKLSSIK